MARLIDIMDDGWMTEQTITEFDADMQTSLKIGKNS